MAKDTKKDTKSKSKSSSSSKPKTSSSSSRPTTPSSRRPSGTTPSTSGQRTSSTRETPSTSAQRTGSTRAVGSTPSSGAVQRTNSGRQIGATPSTSKPSGTTPAVTPSASRAAPAAPAATRAAPAGGAPASTPSAATTAPNANPSNPSMPSAYGSQAGMGQGGDSMYGANSMYGQQQGNSAYGQQGMSAYGQQPDSMYGGAQGGSMYGMGQGGSMYGMGQGGSMYGMGQGGSMYGMGQGGSMYGMGQGGSMYGMNSGYNSMGGSQMGSMYGMNPMMGGSMYGMNPMMGSMYGMGGPMMGGSMYGMNPMMGSMMGGMNPMMGSMMGGPMGSMYGMGSFASYGGGSMYGMNSGMGSLYYSDVGTTSAGPVGGFFSSCKAPMSNENDRLPVRGIELKEDNRRMVRSTKKAEEKERGLTGKDGDAKKDDDKRDDDKKDATKSRSVDADKDGKGKDGKDKDDKSGKSGATGSQSGVSGTRSLNIANAVEKSDNDNATQTVVLIEAKADPEQVKVENGTVTLKDGTPYKPLEIIKAEDLVVARSKSFNEMVEHVALGHNISAVFLSTKAKKVEVVQKAALDTVKAVLSKLGDDKTVKHLKITTIAAATASPTKGKDLLDGNVEKELQFASNPIFGSCVENLKKRTSTDAAGAEKTLKEVLSQKTAPTDLVIVQNIIQHCRAGTVYVSSLTFVFVTDADVAEAVAISDDQKIPMHWLKTTLGGTSRLTVAVALTGDKQAAAEEARYLKSTASMGNNKNQPLRSGNVSRFVEYTTEQMKKNEASLAKATAPEQKASLQQLIDKMRAMVQDATELAAKPEMEPKMYPLTKHRDATGDAKQKSRAIDPVGTTAAPANAEPFTSIHRMAVVTGASAADNGNTVEVVVSGATKAFDVDECLSMKASDAEPGVSKEITRMSGIFYNGCNVSLLGAECVPGVKPEDYKTWFFFRKLLADMLSKSDKTRQNQFQLYMSVVREREVLADLLADTPASAKGPLTVAASPLFGPHVHNTSMKKLTTVAEVHSIVNDALAKAAPFMADDNAMIVATAALKQIRPDDVVVASLFAVSAKDMRPFEGVVDRDAKFSRSLFSYALGGPCSTELLVTLDAKMNEAVAPVLTAQRKVSHTKAAVPRCGSVKEFLKYTRNNKDRMAKKVDEAKDATERARAKNGLKRMEESEKDHEALLKNPATVDLKSYAADDAGAHKANPAEKAASPAAQQRSLPTEGASPAKAATPATKASSPTAQPARAATAAAASPAKAPTPTTATREAAPSASPKMEKKESESRRTPVEFVAVITEEIRQGLETKEGWSVVGDGNKLIVTDVDGPHEFEADEIITRPARNVSLNSSVLEQLREKFLQGNNVALLTADTRGSAASLEMVDRTVRHVLGKIDPSSELFISLCAYKERDGEVCDTMKEGATFEPMSVSSSPLFGPSVTGATYEKVGTAKDFVRVMDKGLRTCGESRACVIVHLVLSTPKPAENDVVVSSFLAVMCPGDISLYRKAIAAAPKERGILQFAIGGPCHTVFAAGFTKNPVDEGCLALPNLANALRETKNTRSPGGSVMRFIQHTRAALKQLQENMDKAASEEEKAKVKKYEESVSGMLKDAESYVASPSGHLPAVYKK